jgi:hypothetical protein
VSKSDSPGPGFSPDPLEAIPLSNIGFLVTRTMKKIIVLALSYKD